MESITSTLKYDQYSDSGYEWIGEIPEHWDLVKLGSCLSPVSVKNCPELPLLSITREQGVIERDVDNQESNHNFIPDDLSGYKKLEKGQFGMNKMKAWQGSYGVSKFTGIVSPAYFIFDFTKAINPEFFNWAIRSKLYVSFFGSASDGVRIGQWDLSKARMKVIPFVLPSEEEQSLIANFLDKKTALIDEAISIKEQQISLLKERKQIIIQQAVTQGLDPNVPMKDSGVDWIGKIPAHWDVKRLKYLGKSIIGLTYSPNDLSDEKGGTLVARSSNLYEGKFKYGEKENVYVNCFIPEHLKLKKGDILICSRNGSRDLIGKCAFVSDADEGNSFGAFTTVFRSKHNEYLFCILNSDVFKMLSGTFLTSTINQLTVGNLNSIFVPFPPSKNERDGIITYINRLNGDVERAIEYQKIQIEKLKEYKTTLINSAVTGKIKITPEMLEQ
ncbi:restriction endonuclease subunit S [Escherichia coli]|uniref:restriction endonuclease subunit S n=1 Tax=Escherichia coli TaxID=562 RepID=UPI0012E0ECCA|nr:restriction endonuclease subunit S [Escherichia coli]MCV5460909.1 restriction endonuclease subunit S [Escherichia coli]QGU45828.1 restriction endonuclease subunit S [Escherichia coli]BEC21012.1 restriction modification system DNA specificity domain-containing protein [Escherichia coli]HAJ7537299.1 restriction endonuclease subunit S [Escherichia coli]HBK9583026.1 restriction endonuclease subunit S [Escherichia coli]